MDKKQDHPADEYDVGILLEAGSRLIGQQMAELEDARIGNAKVVHALDCAVQLIEALIMYLPAGTVLPEGVATAKGALDRAMRELRR